MRYFVYSLVAIAVMFVPEFLFAEAPLPLAEELTSKADLEVALPWQPATPRTEICPSFSFNPSGGPQAGGAWIITTDDRGGQHGCWRRTFSVKGGEYYHFTSLRRTQNVALPRRSTSVRILWQDKNGNAVPYEGPQAEGYLVGWTPTAEPEFPTDKPTRTDGWTEVSDTYRVPYQATSST